MPVVAKPRNRARLDGDQVDPIGHDRHAAVFTQGGEGTSQQLPLAMRDRLLRQAVVAPAAVPDLDDHELAWRPGIDRDDVELRPAHPHVSPEDRPAARGQPARDELLGGIAGQLSGGSRTRRVHGANLRRDAHLRLIAERGELERGHVGEVELAVVEHDGDELALEALVELGRG